MTDHLRLNGGRRPRLLDLFCGAGGCTKGYQRAGFYVVGVDKEPQPNYCGEEFVQADVLNIFTGNRGVFRRRFDAVHASPPCQFYSRLAAMHPERAYPDLIAPVRAWLRQIALPYVIENVHAYPFTGGMMRDAWQADVFDVRLPVTHALRKGRFGGAW